MSEGLETRAEKIDWRVFTAINGLAGRWRALDVPMIAIARYGPIAIALPVVFLCFAGNGQQVSFHRKMALRAALNFAVARVAKEALNRLFPRPRPYEKHNVHLLVKPTEKPSFPSNHTAESWAV